MIARRTRTGRRSLAGLMALTALASAVMVAVTPTPSSAAPCVGYVGLTFNDGPNPNTTPRLLSTLQAVGARATMFNSGQAVQQYPALAQAQKNAGMWVENHAWSHRDLTQLTNTEIFTELYDTSNIILQVTGTRPLLYRPPYGATNDLVYVVAALGARLNEILWHVDSKDAVGAPAEQIAQAADSLKPGEILLMHDGYESTIAAIPQIAADLAKRGLCFGKINGYAKRAVDPNS